MAADFWSINFLHAASEKYCFAAQGGCGAELRACHTANSVARVVRINAVRVRALLVIASFVAPIAAVEAAGELNAATPRFADFWLGVADDAIDGNLILRQPNLVGGVSYDAPDGAPDVTAFGAVARPVDDLSGRGELAFGGNYLANAGLRQWEVQAKYVASGGIGMGAGFARLEAAGDTWFVSAIAKGQRGTLSYHINPLIQDNPNGLSFGGYAALYTDHLFLSGGSDGEHWRALGAWSAHNGGDSDIDPSIEILFVDDGIGRLDGGRFLFVNGSLKRNKGFLSTGSRLGRALGPQGLQFANPVAFLSQPWSRTVDVWETGGIMNLRLARRAIRGESTTTLAQAVVFPMQTFGGAARFRGLFAGIQHEHDALRSTSVLLGHAARLGRASVNIVGSYDIDQSRLSGVLSVRLYF